MVKRCAVPGCGNDSRYYHQPHMNGVTFTPFPKPKTKPLQCLAWVNWLRNYKPHFRMQDVKRSTYICSDHFNDEFFRSQVLTITSSQLSLLENIEPSDMSVNTSLDNSSIVSLYDSTNEEAVTMKPTLINLKLDTAHPSNSVSEVSKFKMKANLPQETKVLKTVSKNHNTHTLDITCKHLSSSESEASLCIVEIEKNASLAQSTMTKDSSTENLNDTNILDNTNSNNSESGVLFVNSNAEQNAGLSEMMVAMETVSKNPDIVNELDNTHYSNLEVSLRSFEAALENRKTLVEIFGKFSSTPEWSLSLSNDSFRLSKINVERGCVLVSIVIQPDYNFCLKILNKQMNGHQLLTNLPSEIGSISDLEKLLNVVNKIRVCSGISEASYLEVFKESVRDDSYMCWYTETIRQNSCSIISHVRRCGSCIKLRVYFRSVMSKRKMTGIPALKKCSKVKLVEELKKSKVKVCELNRKVQRMVEMVNKLNNKLTSV